MVSANNALFDQKRLSRTCVPKKQRIQSNLGKVARTTAQGRIIQDPQTIVASILNQGRNSSSSGIEHLKYVQEHR